MRTWATCTGLLTLLCAPLAAGAQLPISGRVLDAAAGRPVAGATVLSGRTDGERLRGTFTDPEGRFRLTIPDEPGIRVTIERVGYEPVELGAADFRSGAVSGAMNGGVIIRLVPRPIRIAGVEARGSTRCESNPGRGAVTFELWAAARTALRAALLTEEEELVRFRIGGWVRLLDRDGRIVDSEAEEERIVTRQPFDTLEPDELASTGYVHFEDDSLTYFGPDAAVLLSDAFADTHCFHLQESDAAADRTLAGLAFEPVPGRTLPEIRGTIWLEAATGLLQRVDYEYTAAGRVAPDPARGRIEFLALPEGPWIVDRWWIRMPAGGVRRGARATDVHYREAGGEVREVVSTSRSGSG